MESPQSVFPSSSSPPAYFSDLTSVSSSPDEKLIVSNHILSLSAPSDSHQDLESYLRTLPLHDTKSYLLLGLGHDTEGISRARSLDKLVSSMGEILGDSTIFDSARHGIDFDKIVIPDTKLSPLDALNAFSAAGLHLVYSAPFSSPSRSGTLYMLERAPFSFPPLLPKAKSSIKEYNPYGPPSREEWQTMWSAWDAVTLGMIPSEMLHQKPIDLRHKCLFYIGHIPTFLNILMSHLFKEPYTEPKNFTQIFERGIDPHVDDPNHCHSHSEVPEKDEDWPTLESVLDYRDRVRARLMQVYDDIDAGRRPLTRSLSRILQMILEHEGFHIETLLYMLIQRAGTGTLPPPGFTTPPWEALKAQWDSIPAPSSPTVELGPTPLVMGHNDSEADDNLFESDKVETVRAHVFGWDNESPERIVNVEPFRAEWRPVSNTDFYKYWTERRSGLELPASWMEKNGKIFVRTVYGPVPLEIAAQWPVLASYDSLEAFARSKGGRLPTEPELRLFLNKFNSTHSEGANVGFRNWHPVPATAGAPGRLPGSNGGIWEWTSTVFNGHPGLSPTKHFPGYSTDFFDGKHQVVLGASYATIPRLANRLTVRNFYQHNYPYAWVGGRVVYNLKRAIRL